MFSVLPSVIGSTFSQTFLYQRNDDYIMSKLAFILLHGTHVTHHHEYNCPQSLEVLDPKSRTSA